MGKIALITGGNRGIGRSIARALSHQGIGIVLTYRSHQDEAEQAVSELGGDAVALQLDTTQTQTFATFADRLRETLRARWGRTTFDILVNNAGFAGDATLGTTDEATLDALFAVHYKGVYLLTQILATTPNDGTALLADGARIVNMSTGLTRFATAPYAVYASMKGAIEIVTRYWAQELGPRGITVNVIAPGPVATDFGTAYIRDDQQARTELAALAALGRVGEPDDIGPAVSAIVSDSFGWVTGQRIEASGGFRI